MQFNKCMPTNNKKRRYLTTRQNFFQIVRKVVLSSVTSQIHLRYLNLPKKRRSHGSHAWWKASAGPILFVVKSLAEPQSSAQKSSANQRHICRRRSGLGERESERGREGTYIHFPPVVFTLSSVTLTLQPV